MRWTAPLLLALVVGCGAEAPSPAPPVAARKQADPPLSDPATWEEFSAEQLARIHFRTRLPEVRVELENVSLGQPGRMELFYTANDLDKKRWWRVNVVGGQTEQFDEREGWVGRKAMEATGTSP